MNFRLISLLIVLPIILAVARCPAAEPLPRVLRESADPARATLRVQAGRRLPPAIPALITGKFAEHLGANIYNGMGAQILRNPTFADYPFWTGQMSPDGVTLFHSDQDKMTQELRRQAARHGWPEAELGELVAARADGLACFWTRVGSREAVQVSPDTGPQGGRAQRLRVLKGGEGLAQWTYLPAHRVRRYEFEVHLRSPDIGAFTVSLTPAGTSQPAVSTKVKGRTGSWERYFGQLELPAAAPPEAAYRFAVTAEAPGQFVVRHVLLRPADHANGADPDVVRLLKESRLPILRWPGGNFVSGYHWEHGVGLLEQRPTQPNYAWGGIEPNLFGTDEFITFCRTVGCEPMICINAGSGTPAEAARWVEYCNGPVTSPMGARRAAGGHPRPYRVQHWEVGNELWGRWQYHWTTPEGYVDRYQAFAKAMALADPTIKLYACGAPVLWGKQWNDKLIAGLASLPAATTDHPLVGGDVSPATDPLAVYRDFMAVPEVLEQKWGALRDQMRKAGIKQPRLAVTELQMFAHVGRSAETAGPARLTHSNLVNPGTLAEALYDVLVYHAAVRLAPFVEMVTHSATVNHGGGLRKERERVYANPCHYAQAAFAAFAGATPVAVELETPYDRAPRVLPDLKNAVSEVSFGMVDALAAMASDGSLLLSVVHRGTGGPIRLDIELAGFRAASAAEVRTLSASVPWAVNSLDQPEAVSPNDSVARVREGKLELEVRPFSVLRARIPQKL